MLEAIELCEAITGASSTGALRRNRIGDHRWWISDLRRSARLPGLGRHLDVEASCARSMSRTRSCGCGAMKLSVVIPAHNEADSIGET